MDASARIPRGRPVSFNVLSGKGCTRHPCTKINLAGNWPGTKTPQSREHRTLPRGSELCHELVWECLTLEPRRGERQPRSPLSHVHGVLLSTYFAASFLFLVWKCQHFPFPWEPCLFPWHVVVLRAAWAGGALVALEVCASPSWPLASTQGGSPALPRGSCPSTPPVGPDPAALGCQGQPQPRQDWTGGHKLVVKTLMGLIVIPYYNYSDSL